MADTTSVTSTTPATDNRKVWQKSAYDVADQTTDTATDVGFLRQNDSRVDVISTMDKNLKQQVFSFQNLSNSKVQVLSAQAGKSVRIQVLNQAGQVVADSKSGQGQASKTYTAMAAGTYQLKQGKYFLVVQRDPSQSLNSTLPYNVQIKEGDTVKNDYITQNIPEPASITQQKAVSAVQQAAPTLFNTSAANIFGTYASDPFGLGNYDIFGQKKVG